MNIDTPEVHEMIRLFILNIDINNNEEILIDEGLLLPTPDDYTEGKPLFPLVNSYWKKLCNERNETFANEVFKTAEDYLINDGILI